MQTKYEELATRLALVEERMVSMDRDSDEYDQAEHCAMNIRMELAVRLEAE